ncbi:hypothetical protein [Gemella massiliensis]|uniref:hypothetical protein n=1 Tax=Gemella massiliensis TaxID=1909670 RepID=UPI0009FB1F29|nr:hypothetical protein [Gemella massiliensis]
MKKYYNILMLILPILIVYLYRINYNYLYHAVDDVAINYSILNGEYMLLPYIGIVLSYLLVIIQSIIPAINIYFIFLIVAYSLSFSIFLYLVKEHKNKYALFSVILILEILILKYFTYSVVAYLLSLAGVLLLYKNKHTLLSYVVIFVGFSLRIQVITSILILLIAIILYETIVKKEKRKVFSLALIIIAIFLSNKMVTTSNQTVSEYLSWNDKSTQIRDYPAINYEDYVKQLQEINISQNDLDTYNSWIFAEKNVFNENMLSNLDNMRSISEKYNFSIRETALELFSSELIKVFIYFVILFLIFFRVKNRYGYLLILTPILSLIALVIRQRLVERVYIPIICVAILAIILSGEYFFERKRYKILKNTEGISFGILCFLFLSYIISFGKNNLYWFTYQKHQLNPEYNNVLKNNKENLYIFLGYSNIINSQANVSKVFVDRNNLFSNSTTLGTW